MENGARLVLRKGTKPACSFPIKNTIKSTARATGHPHPQLQVVTGNYVGLLMAMGCTQDEALVILCELAPEFFAKPEGGG